MLVLITPAQILLQQMQLLVVLQMTQDQHYIIKIRFVHAIYLMSVKFSHGFLHALQVVNTSKPGEAGYVSGVPFG